PVADRAADRDLRRGCGVRPGRRAGGVHGHGGGVGPRRSADAHPPHATPATPGGGGGRVVAVPRRTYDDVIQWAHRFPERCACRIMHPRCSEATQEPSLILTTCPTCPPHSSQLVTAR